MAHDMLFRGVAPALVTPFTSDDDIDEAAFRRLIDAQIEGGVSALVVLGTTGENPTITEDERRRIVDAALDAADGRVPVIVGTGFVSRKQARMAGSNSACRSRAVARSSSSPAATSSQKGPGRALLMTETAPSPPMASRGSVISSSPE